MTRRRMTLASLVAAGATLLVAALVAPGAQAADGVFGRVQREMASGSGGATTLGGSLLDAAQAAMAGGVGAATQEQGEGGAEEADAKKVDAWATNPALKVARRLMKGGAGGVGGFFQEMMADEGALAEVFSNRSAAHAVINSEWVRCLGLGVGVNGAGCLPGGRVLSGLGEAGRPDG